MRLITNL